jgi:hypothetical protein
MTKKILQDTKKIPNGPKIFPMAIKYLYQNFPVQGSQNVVFVVSKYTTWQPWYIGKMGNFSNGGIFSYTFVLLQKNSEPRYTYCLF